MKKITTGLILPCLLFLIGCNNQRNNSAKQDTDIYLTLKDSMNIFQNISVEDINGEIKGVKARIKYHSISEKTFLAAVRRNVNNIRYFNRHFKLNESMDNAKRKGSCLNIEGEFGPIFLTDLVENRFHRARNFFLENKIGEYYIVKRIQFEDAETIFWNSITEKEDLYLVGISVSTNAKDSFVFYSNTFKIMPEDKNPICLMKIQEGRIDTLCYEETSWFTNFSFFDEKDSSIYYIHSFYEDYELKSTYAKIDFKTE